MKKLVIKPYRQNMGMDLARAQEIWTSLRNAIDEIFSHNASLLSFEELYRNSYNLVLHKHGDLLYNGVIGVITARLEKTAQEIAAVSDDLLLIVLNQKWTDHQIIMTMVRDILMYMDRTYVNQKRKHPIYDSGLYIFRDTIARNPNIRERLRQLLLRTIEHERNGELVDRSLLKNILRMLVDLGVHSNVVYEDDFECYFLDWTLDFYRAEAQAMLDVATCAEYLVKAEKRLVEEANRVSHYLNVSTEHKLKSIVEMQLIKNQAKALVEMENSGCVAMFRDRKVESLRRMYTLFRRVPSTLNDISECVLQYVKAQGEGFVKTQSNPETALDAAQFVENLIALREKFVFFLSDCFFDDPQFYKSIKQGFEAFMNTNTICAGYLAQYIDELLRSKNRFEDDLDTRVGQVIALFRYLQDKDVFEEFYKSLLAKRLLNSRGTSDEAEKIVISKLKAECGYQFTSRLEGMFKDMSISKDLMELFRKVGTGNALPTSSSSKISGTVDYQVDPNALVPTLSVQVLTSGFWPTEMAPMCTLPPELSKLAQSFETFYCARHNGRKLTWMPNMGSVDVRATFLGGVEDGTQRHELSVSTYQAVILMLFNQRQSWRFHDIAEWTRIETNDLKRHLISLCTPKYKILIKSSKGKRIDEEEDTFTINDGYKSKLHRVRIPLVSQKETSLLPALAGLVSTGMNNSADALPPTVQEDRKHLVEAAIVRIMKTRKQMQHNQLIAEVTRQMSGRFTPTPQLIKLRIESLIEREYLQRNASDRRLYNYLA
ncbi:Cullin family protein, partial [Globisporangium splendens]